MTVNELMVWLLQNAEDLGARVQIVVGCQPIDLTPSMLDNITVHVPWPEPDYKVLEIDPSVVE